MHFDLEGTPYSLDETGQGVLDDVAELGERISLLRAEGTLTEATLRAYFGDKRFEQIAESNALEGSTLGVAETQLAVLRGMTITGHDPAYTKDAIALASALDRITELAGQDAPTDLDQFRDIHSLILGYWHTIVTPPMVFARNMVEVKKEMEAKGFVKPIVASLAGDVEVEEAAEYLYQNGIPAYAYSTELPVEVLGAKYKWARGAGLL